MTYRELFYLLADFVAYRQSNENYDPLMSYFLFNIYDDDNDQIYLKLDEEIEFDGLYKKYRMEEIKRQIKSLKENRKLIVDDYVTKYFKQVYQE